MTRIVRSEVQVVGISTAQETALAALRAGNSFTKAAEEAGVNRATVYRWVQRDPAFRAAYNAWQRELDESAHARLLKLSERAVEVLEDALRQRDKEIAFKMLKHLGVLRPRRAGSTDEQVVKLQLELKQKRELRRAEVNLANHILKKAGLPRRERRDVLGGRGTAKFMQDLRAVIDASGRKRRGRRRMRRRGRTRTTRRTRAQAKRRRRMNASFGRNTRWGDPRVRRARIPRMRRRVRRATPRRRSRSRR